MPVWLGNGHCFWGQERIGDVYASTIRYIGLREHLLDMGVVVEELMKASIPVGIVKTLFQNFGQDRIFSVGEKNMANG